MLQEIMIGRQNCFSVTFGTVSKFVLLLLLFETSYMICVSTGSTYRQQQCIGPCNEYCAYMPTELPRRQLAMHADLHA